MRFGVECVTKWIGEASIFTLTLKSSGWDESTLKLASEQNLLLMPTAHYLFERDTAELTMLLAARITFVPAATFDEWRKMIQLSDSPPTCDLPVSHHTYVRAQKLSVRLQNQSTIYELAKTASREQLAEDWNRILRDEELRTPAQFAQKVQHAFPKLYSGTDLLIAIGHQALKSTILYHLATSRPFAVLENIEDLVRFLDTSCPRTALVFFATSIDRSFLTAFDSLKTLSVGYILGRSEDDLEWQTAKALTYSQYKLRLQQDVVYQPTDSTARIDKEGMLITARGSIPLGQQTTLLAIPKRIFALLSHSDGVNTNLGNTVICRRPWIDPAISGSVTVDPPCFYTDYCGRFKIPITEAHLERRFIPPEIVTAEVFLYFVCWGISSNGHASTRISLGSSFCSSENIRFMITTIGSESISYAVLFRALYMLWAGFTLGECAAKLNHDGARFLLLGDPVYSIAVRAPTYEMHCDREGNLISTDVPHTSSVIKLFSDKQQSHFENTHLEIAEGAGIQTLPYGAAISSGNDSAVLLKRPHCADLQIKLVTGEGTTAMLLLQRLDNILDALEFDRFYLFSVLAQGAHSDRPALEKAIRQIDEFTNSTNTFAAGVRSGRGLVLTARAFMELWNELEPQIRAISASVLQAFSVYAAQIGSMMVHHWGKRFSISLRSSRELCWICGNPLTTELWRSNAFSVFTRRLDSCDDCGIVYDGVSNPPAILTPPDRIIPKQGQQTVRIQRIATGVQAWVLIVEASPRRQSFIVPIDSAHEPVGVNYTTDTLPSGTLIQTIACMNDGQLCVWRAPLIISPKIKENGFCQI